MHDLQIILGLWFIPLSIGLFVFAFLWQMYIMMTETYSLNKYKDKALMGVIAALFFTFSLAVYYFCPNARKKGRWFWLALILGSIMYYLQMRWLPRA